MQSKAIGPCQDVDTQEYTNEDSTYLRSHQGLETKHGSFDHTFSISFYAFKRYIQDKSRGISACLRSAATSWVQTPCEPQLSADYVSKECKTFQITRTCKL